MKKLCDVIMLFTKKPSYLVYTEGVGLYLSDLFEKGSSAWLNQHLYIISDDEIKNQDWYYVPNQMMGFEHISNEFSDTKTLNSIGARKIIATTDSSLLFYPKEDYNGRIKKMIPQIPESFLKTYVEAKGNITEVEVEYYRRGKNYNGVDADLTGGVITHKDDYWVVRINEDNTVNITIPTSKIYTKQDVEVLFSKFIKFYNDRPYKEPLGGVGKWLEENL